MFSLRNLLVVLSIGMFFWAGASEAQAASPEVEILIKKLVQKGILTDSEAREIRQEVAQEARSAPVRTAAVSPAAQDTEKDSIIPDWVRRTKLFGDLRLRFESQFRDAATDRNRGRFRFRLGMKTKPAENLEVGVRLATGGRGVPTSTNQSFTDTFDRKSFEVDRAYAKFTPWDWLTVVGGKIANPFVTTDIIWDSDVTPEGAAVQLKGPQDWPIPLFANVGAFQIDEISGDSGDPALFGFQAGSKVKLPFWGAWWKPSIAYYDFTAVEEKTATSITNAPNGNTTTAAGNFRDDFDLVNVISKVKIPDVLGQPVNLVADWTHNTAAEDDENAWQAGFIVGKVTEKLGSWKTYYYYKRIESDSTFAAITDGTFGGGGTDHKGHRMGAEVGLAENWSMGVNYYNVHDIDADSDVNTFQVETIVKF